MSVTLRSDDLPSCSGKVAGWRREEEKGDQEEGGWREYVPGAKMTGPERRRKRGARRRDKEEEGMYSIEN